MSLNRVTLIGNLGSDPDIRPTAEGMVCTFSIATNEFIGSESIKPHTEWHNIVTFGKLAQNCSKFLKKGSKVFLEGRLRTSAYTDKDNHEQIRTKINAATVQFLDRRQDESELTLTLESSEPEIILEDLA